MMKPVMNPVKEHVCIYINMTITNTMIVSEHKLTG